MQNSRLPSLRLLAVLAACGTLARADLVETKNGSRLTGTVTKVDAGAITLVTDYAGTLSIKQSEVVRFETEKAADVDVRRCLEGIDVAARDAELLGRDQRCQRPAHDREPLLVALAHDDFAASPPIGRKGRVFRQLESAYRLLTGKYRSLNLRHAANHQYLEALVEHVSVALICLDGRGEVTLMNREAKALFRTPHLASVKSFGRIDPQLPAVISELSNGARTLIGVKLGDESLQLALFATEFDLVSERYKLILGADPPAGIDLMVESGLGDVVLPEVGAMRMAIDEHHQHKDVYQHSLTVLRQAIELEDDGPDLVLRWAALLHDIGKPATRRHEPGGGVSFHHHEVVGAKMVRKRMRALKYSKQMVDDVSQLVYLHLRFHGYGDGKWTDSAVRRYVTDAGPLLGRLHKLVRADCTTRNKRRAARLQANYDDLEARIAEIAAKEDLQRVRPDLDGNEIMKILDIPAGPQVGEAWKYLKELRLDRGPLSHDEAVAELLKWWNARS